MENVVLLIHYLYSLNWIMMKVFSWLSQSAESCCKKIVLESSFKKPSIY